MREPREFVFRCEHMGGTTWTVEHQWAIEGEAEEVVRCMDCKYYIEDSESCTWFHTLPFGDEVEVMTHPNGFCAWGERG